MIQISVRDIRGVDMANVFMAKERIKHGAIDVGIRGRAGVDEVGVTVGCLDDRTTTGADGENRDAQSVGRTKREQQGKCDTERAANGGRGAPDSASGEWQEISQQEEVVGDDEP